MVFAQNGRAHARRRRDNWLLDAISSVVVESDESGFLQVLDSALHLRGAERWREHPADFLGGGVCGEERQQVAQDGVVPLRKELEGGILELEFLLARAYGEEFLEQVFALVHVFFVAEAD